MKEDKVAQRKNKSRKKNKVTTKNNEEESVLEEEDIETRGEQVQVDICDIAEQCFMEEIGQDTDITDLVNVETLDIDQDQSWAKDFCKRKVLVDHLETGFEKNI